MRKSLGRIPARTAALWQCLLGRKGQAIFNCVRIFWPCYSGSGIDTTFSNSRNNASSFIVLDKDPSRNAPSSLPSLDIQAMMDNSRMSDEADTLSKLFGADLESSKTIAWNDLVSQKWHDLVRGGLMIKDQRTILIKKYLPSNEPLSQSSKT